MVDLREALRPLRESPVADPEPVERLAGRVVRRRRRRRVAAGAAGAAIAAMVAVGVWAGGSSHPEVVQVAGPAEPESSRPGGGLELTYLPEGFALADDVEHVRHQLGDRLRVLTYRSNAPAAGPTFEVHRKVGNPLSYDHAIFPWTTNVCRSFCWRGVPLSLPVPYFHDRGVIPGLRLNCSTEDRVS